MISTGQIQMERSAGAHGLLAAVSPWLNTVVVLGLTASLITLAAFILRQTAAVFRGFLKLSPAIPRTGPSTQDRVLSSRRKCLYGAGEARCSSS